jgi:hypothetical protein
VNSITEEKNEDLTTKVDELLNIIKGKKDNQVNAITNTILKRWISLPIILIILHGRVNVMARSFKNNILILQVLQTTILIIAMVQNPW